MNDTVRIGIVGAGGNTKGRHIPGLQAIAGVEIVSVCNRSIESSTKVAGQFNIPKIYGDWRSLVEAPDTNAIVIGTWPNLHRPITLAALAAGKHVMCEARMARNSNEAREMLQAAAARPELVAQVVPAPFTLHLDRTVKRSIAEGFVGDVLAVEVKQKSGFLDTEGALGWRQDFGISGFNTMALGIWYETVMRWIGAAKRVVAMGDTFVKMRRDPNTGEKRAVRIPEHIDVIAEMACGAQAHFGLSQVSGFEDSSEVSLFGSLGTLCFAENQLFGGQRGDEGMLKMDIPAEEEGGWRVEEEFVNAIRGEEQITHTTFEDGVCYMEFTEAVIRSMDEGRAISLPLR